MRELLVLRHAESEQGGHPVRDHDRTLSERGREDAKRMGRHLVENDLVPDVVLCSSATRTTETCALVCDSGTLHPKIEFIEQLYLASHSCMIKTTSQRANEGNRVLLIGHNPGCEDVLHSLGLGMHQIPTCTLARISLEIDDWLELEGSCKATLLELVRTDDIEKA